MTTRDHKKTKAQLVSELAELRQRLSEVDGSVPGQVPREAPYKVERRRVKERRSAEVRYHDLFDNAPDMFLSVDSETATIQVCNQTLATALGYTKEEIVGRPIFDLYHPDCTEEVQAAFRTFLETGEVQNAELQLQRNDGSKIDVLMNVSAVRDEQGKIRYGRSVLRDITEHKKAEQARARALEELTASRASLRKLAARLQEVREDERIALARELHDELGQILTAAQMDLGWIRSHAPPDSPQLMHRIREALKLLKEGVETVQELSSRLRPPALDLVGLQEVLADHVLRFGERAQLDAEVDLGEGDWPMCPAAQTAVFRIVQEALTNVARHAKASRVRLDARSSEGRLVLTLRDDGVGIGEQELEAGDSLGLVGMAERALSVGGSLEIRRAPEGGTDVVLQVPLSDTGAEAAEAGR